MSFASILRSSLLLAAGAALCSCGPSGGPREPDEFDSATMMGCGSDETWRTFNDRETTNQVTVDDTQAPSFNTPAAGATLPASPKPTFAWQPSSSIVGKPPLGDASCTECPACGPLTASHLPPVSGDAYDIQFTVDGQVVYRIVYTSQQWTPPDALWASWRGKTVEIRAWRAVLKVNDLVEGPYTGSKPWTFTVGS